MIARSVHHISFAVRDLARSQHFYQEILGLERIERPDLGLPGVWYRAGNAEVHLIATPEGVDVGSAAPSLTPLANHQAFAVDDYAKTLDFLEAREVEVLRTTPEAGQLWIRDPDGNVIELIARHS
jgi:catechol 2,3-dioxygenase-like lactoylglutathione lyase family enzyme